MWYQENITLPICTKKLKGGERGTALTGPRTKIMTEYKYGCLSTKFTDLNYYLLCILPNMPCSVVFYTALK